MRFWDPSMEPTISTYRGLGSCKYHLLSRTLSVENTSTERTQWNNRTEIVYPPTMLATKLSILFMYLRTFMPIRKSKTDHLTQFIIWFNVLFYLSILVVASTGCVPRHKVWQRWVPGKCVNEQALLLVTAVINVLSDLSILILPIGCIWRLQLSRKLKLAVSALFATGSV